MREPNRWYVTYTLESDSHPRRRIRVARTFDTEEQAKQFARETAVTSARLTAGTINPHLPKRIVSTAEIATWIASVDEPTNGGQTAD
jgi:hypothetical protein